MKNEELFYNPFRLISPKLDAEASRLEELFESVPEEVTCLEEGLLVMLDKLAQMTDLVKKCLLSYKQENVEEVERLGKEVHEEEKDLTSNLVVCSPTETTGDVLKAVILFPGRLERVGDHLESALNVACIKERTGVPFSERAHKELDELLDLLKDVMQSYRDVLLTRDRALLLQILDKTGKIAQMSLDFAYAHESRLIEGLCSPKASSLFLDLLDAVKHANQQLHEMGTSLLKVAQPVES
jgi:Na+/phosphate symporter